MGKVEAAAPTAQAVPTATRVPFCNVEWEAVPLATRGFILPMDVSHVPGEFPHALRPDFFIDADALRMWGCIPDRKPDTVQQ